MTGGANADSSNGTIYSYSVPQGGYAPNGNIMLHSDSVMGDWQFSYDTLNRLVTATQIASTPTSKQYAGNYGCWSYDAFGNRTQEAFSATGCGSSPPLASWAKYASGNNRIATASTAPAGYVYDAGGNTLYDGNNHYWYDAEGRLCAVQSQRYTSAAAIQYVYDAEGARIGQGTLASAPSSYTATCAPPMGAGFTLTKQYLLDLSGNQVTELNRSGQWQHTNVWTGGKDPRHNKLTNYFNVGMME
jgi:hypothetical protein